MATVPTVAFFLGSACQARYVEAESLLVRGYAVLSRAVTSQQETRDPLGDLVVLHRTWGRPAQAARYGALLRGVR